MVDSNVVLFAFIICMAGLLVKMAIFPVHGWLPGAYSEASPVSAGLVAPLTTKVTLYIMIRLCLSVFGTDYVFGVLKSGEFMVWLAVATIIFGSISALAQHRVRKMLTYIIIAEVGYIVGGFFLGNQPGMSGAILHIVNDAFMTLALFMGAAILIWKTRGETRNKLPGLFAKMPFSMAGLVLAGLSVIGVPPTCGFFSKWYLISGGIQAGHYAFVAALIFSSLINAVLFFRIFEIAYFEPFTDHHGSSDHSEEAGISEPVISEAPMGMLIPFLTMSLLLVVLGLYSGTIVTNIIQFALPTGVM